jgi:D-alanyl-D-alanine carboxypeptidase
MSRLQIVVIGLAVALGVGASQSTATSEKPSASPPVERVARDLAHQGSPGVIVYVSVAGKEYIATAGARRPRANQRFRIGSITKTFTAAILLQLVQEGAISLASTLEEQLPGIAMRGDEMTMRMLLSHHSGLVNYSDTEFWPWLIPALASPATQPIDIARFAGSQPLVFEPGTQAGYSNTNYIMLGLVIEKLERASYSDVLERRILKPLQLDHTGCDGYIQDNRDSGQSIGAYCKNTPGDPGIAAYCYTCINTPGSCP